MNIREKIVQYPVACVAAAAIIGGLLVGIVGHKTGADHQKSTDTTAFAPPLFGSDTDPDTSPSMTDPTWEYGVQPLPGELDSIDDPDIALSQQVFPAPHTDVPDIYPLQSDGGEVHCRPQGNIVAKSASSDDQVAINNNLVELWSDGTYLMVSPRDSAIGRHQMAIVVNGTFANWLPETRAGGVLALDSYNWMSDDTMWWHLQICSVTE